MKVKEAQYILQWHQLHQQGATTQAIAPALLAEAIDTLTHPIIERGNDEDATLAILRGEYHTINDTGYQVTIRYIDHDDIYEHTMSYDDISSLVAEQVGD